MKITRYTVYIAHVNTELTLKVTPHALIFSSSNLICVIVVCSTSLASSAAANHTKFLINMSVILSIRCSSSITIYSRYMYMYMSLYVACIEIICILYLTYNKCANNVVSLYTVPGLLQYLRGAHVTSQISDWL